MRRMAMIAVLCGWIMLTATGLAARADDTTERTLVHEAIIDAPIKDVWDAFTTTEGITSWMVPVGRVDLRVGGEMRTSYNAQSTLDDEHTIVNRILSYEPRRMLSIQNVRAPAGFRHADLFQQTWSVIYFRPLDAGRTKVRIVGLGYGEGEDWDIVYKHFEWGNAVTLDMLRKRFAPTEDDASLDDSPPTDEKANTTMMKNTVVHFEIGCRDHAATCKFYSDLFGWNISPQQPFIMPKMVDGHPVPAEGAIGGHINSLGHEPHNYVTIYVQVNDLAASLKKAEELGGRTIVPPTEVPQMGHFAWMQDPEGNCIGLWKPMAGQ